MSDHSTTERSSLGSAAFQNHANLRTKFQPIRVKDLDISESDDDEIEEKAQDSEVESDSDYPQPLPQNNSFEGVFESSLKCDKNPETVEETSQEPKVTQHTPYPNVPSELDEFNFTNEEKRKKACSTDLGVITSVLNERNHIEQYSSKCDNIKQDSSKSVWSSNLHHVDVDVKYQENVLSTQRNNCSRNEQPIDAYLDKHNVQAKNQEDNSKSDINSIDVVSQSCGNVMQSNVYNSQSTNTKVETLDSRMSTSGDQSHSDGASCSVTLHTSDAGSILNSIDQLAMETPLKHPSTSTARPNPCFSRRNLIQTPQNKIQSDLSKTHGQTPATILSHWSQNNMRQTPLQSKSMSTRESMLTPKTSSYLTPSMARHEAPRFFNTETKSARRPLADAAGFMQSDIPLFPSETKSRLVQGMQLLKVDEVVPKSQRDFCINKRSESKSSTAKRMLDISENAVQEEPSTNEQIKENKHPNCPNELEDKERLMKNRVPEGKQAANSIASLDVRNNSVQSSERNNKPATKTACNEPQSQYPVSSKQKQQQDLKPIVDNISNVQFSIPSNVPKSKQNKTLFVKEKEYLVLGTLGQGMSGEVLRVQDVTTLELCAIKCVNLSRMDKDSAQGCLEEISMLHKLQAPCIVRMFDYEIKYPMVYVVMEMGDTDLSRLLKSMSQDKQLPLTMILYYWTEMLTAVKHIHDNGVIHSDLKPANFLLVRGRLKLIDFGIASSMNADMTSVVKDCPIGTLNYISPEALMDTGENSDSPNHKVKYKITFKSDVWSLGCILYSLVYGHTPFHHIRSQWAKVNAITNPKPNISFAVSSSSRDSAQKSVLAPPVLIDVMRKCLQHDPKARPTVMQLLQIQYVPTRQERVLSSTPEIPANILVKIKHTLTEDEWRQLVQILENKRYT